MHTALGGGDWEILWAHRFQGQFGCLDICACALMYVLTCTLRWRFCVVYQGIKDRQLCARLHEVAAEMVNQEWAMKRERTKAKQRLMYVLRRQSEAASSTEEAAAASRPPPALAVEASGFPPRSDPLDVVAAARASGDLLPSVPDNVRPRRCARRLTVYTPAASQPLCAVAVLQDRPASVPRPGHS